MPRNRANSNVGKLIWIGLQSSGRSWFEVKDGTDLIPLNYSNWGLAFKQLNNPGWGDPE